jgi:Co/Zn/Cd efflux system component
MILKLRMTSPVRRPLAPRRTERGITVVLLLTAVMMTIEIAVGYGTNSMALLADGWHRRHTLARWV